MVYYTVSQTVSFEVITINSTWYRLQGVTANGPMLNASPYENTHSYYQPMTCGVPAHGWSEAVLRQPVDVSSTGGDAAAVLVVDESHAGAVMPLGPVGAVHDCGVRDHSAPLVQPWRDATIGCGDE